VKRNRLKIYYSSWFINHHPSPGQMPPSPRPAGRGTGRRVRSLRIFEPQFHRHRCFGYFRCNSDLIRG
jgi:hypothetical protein